MDDGTRVLMTDEELRAAAETQTDEPLTKDHPEDETGRPKYPPDVDETFGKVSKSGWIEDQQAVAYEAMTHDQAVATGVQAGSYDVSVHPFFNTEPYDGPEADVTATDIRFGDLSVVSKGDSPSATAEWGPNEALASWTAETDIGAELTASADGAGDGGGRQSLISSTVRGTLEALGLTADAVDPDSIDTGNEGAESSANPQTPNMSDNPIETLVDEHGFEEDSLENMSDEDLERLSKQFDGDSTDTTGGSGDGGDGQTTTNGGDGGSDTDGTTLADMTVDDLADGLQERGFVTEDNADEVVAQANKQTEKSQKVEEIIAKSDDFDDDDRQELLASSSKVIDREFERVRGAAAATLPGTAGSLTAAAPGNSDSDNDVDAYGTGVQED
ncbi:hypothetical protein [Halorubrum trueperi]